MSSTYGDNLKLSIFGQSHGPAIGMTLDGIPAGLPVDPEKLQKFLNRRAPGQGDWSTPRKEEDKPEFLGGLLDGFTCGAPIAAVIYNRNTRSGDYDNLKSCPRPGHADYTAQIKYGGFQDAAGGGHFSGRLTAPLCIAGGLCKQWLEELGIRIHARIQSIADVEDPLPFHRIHEIQNAAALDFPTVDPQAATRMKERIAQARSCGDSVGGVIQCVILGLPAGIGEPMFGGVESKIAQIVYGIPAVKGLEFGDGFALAESLGSAANDSYEVADGHITAKTNHNGGILGGITNGMPVTFQVAVKPTPSIAQMQQTVNLQSLENATVMVNGRHDPCIVPRAVPVIEAAAAVAIYDLILGNTQTTRRKP